MGQEAEVKDELIEEPQEETVEEVTEEVVETTDEETEETETIDEPELELVRKTKGSQPKSGDNLGIRKRINQLNQKVETEKQGRTEAEIRADILAEQNRVKELRIQELEGAAKQVTKPDPDTFDGGVGDPDYIKQLDAYQEDKLNRMFEDRQKESIEKSTQANAQILQAQQLEKNQARHYENAEKLGLKGYYELENEAIKIMGKDIANGVIADFSEDSPKLFAYLGKNPNECRDLTDLLNTNRVKGIAEIGRLLAEIEVKPKTKPAPDPDEELEGGISGTRKQRKGGPKFW